MQAAGNWTLALLLCVCSNAAAVATVPLTLKLLLTSTADGASVHLNATGLLLSLVLTIVAPLCVAKVARDNCPPLRALGHEHQTTLSLISNTSLILIVWQSVSRAQVPVLPLCLCVWLSVCTWLPPRKHQAPRSSGCHPMRPRSSHRSFYSCTSKRAPGVPPHECWRSYKL